MQNPPRALILDFDGLMLDTETAVFEAWREFYEEEGQHLAVSDWLSAVGYVNGFDPRAHLEKLTGRPFHWPDHDPRLSQRTLELVRTLPPFPGVSNDILQRLDSTPSLAHAGEGRQVADEFDHAARECRSRGRANGSRAR